MPITGYCIRRSAPTHSKRGILIEEPQDRDRVAIADTIQCCHCQRVWVYKPGCGHHKRDFGWCSRCNGYHCGASCETCVYHEQMIENMEKGMLWDEARQYRPIRVSVPCSPGGVLLGKA